MPGTVFGPIVIPDDVTRAVEQHVRTWQRSYLDHVAVGRGFSRRLPSIRSYRTTNERPERWADDPLPTLVIVTEDPEGYARDGDGSAEILFPVGLAVVVTAAGQRAASKLAQCYAGALALLLNEKPDLGIGEVVDWIPYSFGDLEPENDSLLSACSQGVIVQVPDALSMAGGGPRTPTPDDDDPTDENYFTAATVEIDLTEHDPKEEL